jgi:uncharacterized membrane protein YhaH (DUF805 family)
MTVVIPYWAMKEVEYPLLGVGTGMLQNVRIPMGIEHEWNYEGDVGRQLIELGGPGYLLFWFARLGLLVAFARAGMELSRHKARGVAGIAWVLALFAIISNLAFDHVWQALFFLAGGVVLLALFQARGEGAGPQASTARTSG